MGPLRPIVAYSRPRNIGDYITKAQFHEAPGKDATFYMGKYKQGLAPWLFPLFVSATPPKGRGSTLRTKIFIENYISKNYNLHSTYAEEYYTPLGISFGMIFKLLLSELFLSFLSSHIWYLKVGTFQRHQILPTFWPRALSWLPETMLIIITWRRYHENGTSALCDRRLANNSSWNLHPPFLFLQFYIRTSCGSLNEIKSEMCDNSKILLFSAVLSRSSASDPYNASTISNLSWVTLNIDQDMTIFDVSVLGKSDHRPDYIGHYQTTTIIDTQI